MGIRPSFHFMFGIDDMQATGMKITDPRFTGDQAALDELDPISTEGLKRDDYYFACRWNDMVDVFTWQIEFGLSNIFGVSFGDIYGHEAYFMAASGDYDEPGWTPIKSVPSTYHTRSLQYGLPERREGRKEATRSCRNIKRGWQLKYYSSWECNHMGMFTVWAMRRVGWKIYPKDIKPMLYWYWA